MLSVKSNSSHRSPLARRWTASAAAFILIGCASVVTAQQAEETSVTRTGGYLVFPKIVVHTTGPGNPALAAGALATDTVIQLTNTTNEVVVVNCYYVNANGHCGGPGPGARVCQSNSECIGGQECVPGWNVRDFQIRLTPNQPLGWTASSGFPDGLPCETNACGNPPEFNSNSTIPGVQENPFIGELKCYQIDPLTAGAQTEEPLNSNDLKGEATIVQSNAPTGGNPPAVLASAYNAVSFRAQSDPGGTGPLCLGDTVPPGSAAACAATYTPCPGTLMLQHYFEGATTPNGVVNTELTLVPCSEDLSLDGVPPLSITAQMLVYNEFEQRFSTNSRVQCYQNVRLSDIDTRRGLEGDSASIFAVGVQGTLGGNTRIRGVQGAPNGFGYGLLGLAQSYYAPVLNASPESAAAYHLNTSGSAAVTDAVYKP